MFTLYNVTSSDGFIATKDDGEDFIPDKLWQGFLDLCIQYGAFVMGRKTYETIQGYDQSLVDPFEKLNIPRIVISSNKDFKVKPEYQLVTSPEEASRIAPNALVSSGPTLNNCLLDKHMVGKITQRIIPVEVGNGIRPFDKTKLGNSIVEIIE